MMPGPRLSPARWCGCPVSQVDDAHCEHRREMNVCLTIMRMFSLLVLCLSAEAFGTTDGKLATEFKVEAEATVARWGGVGRRLQEQRLSAQEGIPRPSQEEGLHKKGARELQEQRLCLLEARPCD